MNSLDEQALPEVQARPISFPIPIVSAAIAAIILTYLLATASLDVHVKTRGFSAILAAFVSGCILIYFHERRRAEAGKGEQDLGKRLEALGGIADLLGTSLNSADALRLVLNRIQEIVPATSAALWTVSPSGIILKQTEGPIGPQGTVLSDPVKGSAHHGEVRVSGATAAIPLHREGTVFAVLELTLPKSSKVQSDVLSAIGTRVAAVLLGSFANDRTRENALTDTVTDLPNERAFLMVLENQVAETVRKRATRPLTILAMDIKRFDEINRRFGHSTGDLILGYVADTAKSELRNMDFFARASNDEFLAILPTASKEISCEVIARVEAGFFNKRFKAGETGSVEIAINFGWAEFGQDGETASEILATARRRKTEGKMAQRENVLDFYGQSRQVRP